MAENIRTFIAVLISNDLKRKIAVVQEDFKKVAPEVKWVEEDNFHITVKFLGDVNSDRLKDVTLAVSQSVADLTPFEAEIGGFGAFPNARRPRVVWAGIETGQDELKALAERVENALETLGFPKEDRPFSAHVTIGRVRDERRVGGLTRALEDAETGRQGSIRVESVAIMKSELRRNGPIYSALAEVPLTGTEEGSVNNG